MKAKKLIITFVLTIALASTSFAQIFMLSEDEYNYRLNIDQNEFNVMVPEHDVNYDQYLEHSPIGDGWLLFGAFGSIFAALKKRKKKESGS